MLITKEKAVSMITQVNSTTIGKFVPTIPNCFNFEDLMLASTAIKSNIQSVQHIANLVVGIGYCAQGLDGFRDLNNPTQPKWYPVALPFSGASCREMSVNDTISEKMTAEQGKLRMELEHLLSKRNS